MKTRLLQTLLFLFPFIAQGQGPGSIAFLGFQTNAPDGFTFVNLQAFPPNTVIQFTDNGWDGSALFTNENTLTWTSPSTTLPAGSIMYIYNSSSDIGLLDGPGSVTGELPNLSASGDQVLAYSGSSLNPTFLATISNSNFTTTCASPGVPVNNTTCLPSTLTIGENAQTPVNSETPTTNMFFNIGSFNGTPDELLDAIMNISNWTISSDINVAGAGQWPGWNFNIEPPAPASISIASGNLNMIEGTPENTITLNLSAPAFGNQNLSLSLSGTINASDISSIPSISGNSIPVIVPTGATSVTVQISAIADGNPEGTENGVLTISGLSSGLVSGNPSSITLQITEPSDVSVVSFQDPSTSISESNGSSSFNLLFDPATNENQTVTIALTNSEYLNPSDFILYPEQTALFNIDIPAGSTDYTLDVLAVEDLIVEADESFTLSILSTSSGLLIGAANSHTVTILENDQDLLPSQLFINEVQSSNVNGITYGNEIHSDWIEIYNNSAQAVDLAGLTISDDIENPFKYRFPEGFTETIIPANGFKILWADDSTEAGPLHLNFKISNGGEFVGLFGIANQAIVIDSLTVPALLEDESFGLLSDGGNESVVFVSGTTTPGLSNLQASIEEINSLGQLKLYPVPASSFVHLMNTSNHDFNLQIYSLEGKLVYSSELQGYETKQISTSFLENGLYSVVSFSKFSVERLNFIVQH